MYCIPMYIYIYEHVEIRIPTFQIYIQFRLGDLSDNPCNHFFPFSLSLFVLLQNRPLEANYLNKIKIKTRSQLSSVDMTMTCIYLLFIILFSFVANKSFLFSSLVFFFIFFLSFVVIASFYKFFFLSATSYPKSRIKKDQRITFTRRFIVVLCYLKINIV